MNVTGGGTKLLFCEGQPQSLDNRLLDEMLRGRTPTTLIVPSGGKQGLRAFVRGRLAGLSPEPGHVVFRVRDFDVEPPDDVRLISQIEGRPFYLSYRAAVENYLLDADLIDAYWNSLASIAPKWSHGESPGVADIRKWMDEAAGTISSYQAIRWSLAGLKPSARWPELRTTWTEGSGHLPTSLAEADCMNAARQLVDDFTQETSGITVDNLNDRYDRLSKKFASPDFLSQQLYLVWFHGKDLQKAMQKLRANTIPLRNYFEWAVENLEWRQHSDLQQLADEI